MPASDNDPDRSRRGMTRRDLMAVGTASLLGLALPARPVPAAAPLFGSKAASRDVSVIMLWMDGGPSHIDTFDPKPEADVAIRGPFGAMETNVAGIRISEHLPKLAARMDKIAILRGVSHGDGSHERARHYLRTGLPPTATRTFPSYGAVIAQEKGGRNGMPPYVSLTQGPATSGCKACVLASADESAWSAKYLPADNDARLSAEYGNTEFGQRCSQARRFIEAGTRFVSVEMPGWDTHDNNFRLLKNSLLPDLDTGLSALLTDLERRGLLESTLVIWMGEFGRSPVINGNGGRDHWPNAMSVVMAGGGVRGGQVIGKTDPRGMVPVERPLRVEDVAATIYRAVGISPNNPATAEGGAVEPATAGRPISELF